MSESARQVTGCGLCVFVRTPTLGRVKTRLAASLGESAALAAHVRLAEHTLRQVVALNEGPIHNIGNTIEAALWLSDSPPDPAAQSLVNAWEQRLGVTAVIQQGAELGERMAFALSASLATYRRALLIGADCPPISAEYLKQAEAALRGGADVVLGPAEDGGYGLIGMHKLHAELFCGIDWGTAKVLGQTLVKAEQLQLQVQLLEPIWDVDELADWQRFLKEFCSAG